MNNKFEPDNLDELLGKSGDYLMTRTAQYREQPMRVLTERRISTSRSRRVLSGSAAAATLCVTALAGSFIGGNSSGKVSVANAAWSAVPAVTTDADIVHAERNCGVNKELLASNEQIDPSMVPNEWAEPAMVEVRGTTITAVFFTTTKARVCVVFGDESTSQVMISLTSVNDHSPFMFVSNVEVQKAPATMIIGSLPRNESGGDSPWTAVVDVVGGERVTASVQKQLGRYVAWVPGVIDGQVKFVNTVTNEERAGSAIDAESATISITPVTTVPVNTPTTTMPIFGPGPTSMPDFAK